MDFCSAIISSLWNFTCINEREKTGKGQRVQTSLLQSALTMTNSLIIEQELLKVNRVASQNRAQTSGPSDTFKNQRRLDSSTNSGSTLFKRWAELVGAEEWLNDERFKDDLSRGNNSLLISKKMAEWCSKRTNHEAMQELEPQEYPWVKCFKAKDVMNDPHIKEQKVYKDMQYPELDKTVPVVGPAYRAFRQPGEIRTRDPY